jgi:chloramphenicol 3-O-phosphotransferase
VNLIFVYGPPAVGKHTVATELTKLIDYRLFHNHLTIPTVNAIFAEKGPARSRLLKDLRLVSIAAAAGAGINLIFTAAYSGGPEDEEFIQNIADIVEGTPGGRMMYVQLYAPREVLEARVSNESRKLLRLEKMTDPEAYQRQLRLTGRDIMVSVKYEGILMIDTTELPPHEAAQKIVQHFQL